MEIEKKYLVSHIPDNLDEFHCRHIEQGYLSTNPVVRVRRDNDKYYLTYKGKGMMVREEYNLPLTRESYEHLIKKADGVFEGTVLAEVEFSTVEEADNYIAPDFFIKDVTNDSEYHNSNMSKKRFDQ